MPSPVSKEIRHLGNSPLVPLKRLFEKGRGRPKALSPVFESCRVTLRPRSPVPRISGRSANCDGLEQRDLLARWAGSKMSCKLPPLHKCTSSIAFISVHSRYGRSLRRKVRPRRHLICECPRLVRLRAAGLAATPARPCPHCNVSPNVRLAKCYAPEDPPNLARCGLRVPHGQKLSAHRGS